MPFDTPIQVLGGPDVGAFAETARITLVQFTPGDFIVRHTKEGTGRGAWPAVVPPGWDGPTQWTLYIVLKGSGGWVTTPCIIYWPEITPSLGVHRGGDPAPFSSGARNWWYQTGGMAGLQPGPGERIGVLAVAGAYRGLNVPTVQERSNVAWVTVPSNDTMTQMWPEPTTPTDPVPLPPPLPDDPGPSPQPMPDSEILTRVVSLVMDRFMAIQTAADQRQAELIDHINALASGQPSDVTAQLQRGFDLNIFGTRTHISPTPKK